MFPNSYNSWTTKQVPKAWFLQAAPLAAKRAHCGLHLVVGKGGGRPFLQPTKVVVIAFDLHRMYSKKIRCDRIEIQYGAHLTEGPSFLWVSKPGIVWRDLPVLSVLRSDQMARWSPGKNMSRHELICDFGAQMMGAKSDLGQFSNPFEVKNLQTAEPIDKFFHCVSWRRLHQQWTNL